MSFEWRKDEEEGWEDQVSVSVVVERPSPPLRLYATIAVVLIILGGIGYWQLSKRARATVQMMEAETLASVDLWQEAWQQRDAELFESVLSRQDGRWLADQQGMWGAVRYWDRPTMGLYWLATAVVSPTITLSPDLTQAEVVLPQPYRVQLAGGVTETIVLSQTAVFRRSADGWLLAAPDDDFWGEEQTLEGQHVVFTFPAKDRPVVLQLIDKLDSIIKETCFRVTNVPCHPELRVPVELTTRFMSLHDRCFPTDYPDQCQIELPTPTILGLPQNEVGLAALTRGYAAHILPPLLPTISGWNKERPTFYAALIEQEMYQWGFPSYVVIRPPGSEQFIMSANDYEYLLNRPVTLQEIGLLWASGGFEFAVSRNHIRALIAFLLERGETAVSLQRRIATPNFWEWANLPANDPATEQAWLQFLYDQSASAAQLPPVSLPDAAVRLVCGDGLFRYDGLTWQDEMRLYNRQSLVEIVPHDNGLIVSGRYYEESAKEFRGRAFWVRGQKSIQLTEWRTNTDAPLISGQYHDPMGRKLVLQEIDRVTGNPLYRLLDLDDCREDACSMSYLPSWPLWAPDGRSTILMEIKPDNPLAPQPTQLWLGDAEGQVVAELGQGYAPFWLDDSTYGYVRLDSNGRSEVVTADIADNAPHVLLMQDGLRRQLPDSDDLAALFIADVQIQPTNNDRLLVTVITTEQDRTFLFRIERQDEQTHRVTHVLDEVAFVGSAYSPDGRWLVLNTIARGSGEHTLTLVTSDDFVTDNQLVLDSTVPVNYDWTADGQWLVINYPGFAKLITPGYNYQRIIPHVFGNCERVAWVE